MSGLGYVQTNAVFGMRYTQIILYRCLVVVGANCILLGGIAQFEANAAMAQEDERSELVEEEDGQTVVTTRRNNSLREGPGSFHKVIVVIKKGVPLTVLEQKRGWIRVELPDERTGWIAEVGVRPEAEEDVSPGTVPEEWVQTEATETGVTAAIRGFQMRAEDLDQKDVDRLEAFLEKRPLVSAEDVESFQTPLLDRIGRSDLDLNDLEKELTPYDPTVEEIRVGFAVAARLAAQGLVEAPRVRRYLSLIAEQLTRNTPYYDLNFDILILDEKGPDAFACPGGIIFVTRGVFSHFKDEAQLAGLLAHEIGHVVRHHGKVERKERQTKIKAEKAFAELEQETEDEDERYEQAEERLNSLMQESYERVVNDRLLKYEMEADRIAASFLAEAGYAPDGILEAAQHIAALRSEDPGLFEHSYLEEENISKRLKDLRLLIRAQQGTTETGKRLPNRFRAYAEKLE